MDVKLFYLKIQYTNNNNVSTIALDNNNNIEIILVFLLIFKNLFQNFVEFCPDQQYNGYYIIRVGNLQNLKVNNLHG